jgi:hypothetical protein
MYVYHDGHTIRKSDRYCGVRALCIATGMDWAKAENLLKPFVQNGKQRNGSLSRGIWKEDYEACLNSIGWYWRTAPKFQGRKAKAADLPKGTHIARMAKHYVCVIDGVVYDTWDSSEKMVYGYWSK